MREHGKISTYVHGCHCDECRQAKNAAQVRRRHSRGVQPRRRGDAWAETEPEFFWPQGKVAHG
jgi:hypothetical protein